MSFELNAGELALILGENGTGKSTLLNLLLGLRTPKSGNISLLGQDPKQDSIQLKQKYFFVSPQVEINQKTRVEYYLNYISLLYPKYDREKERELTELFKLNLRKEYFQLSLGQKIRIQIIAALASGAELLIIDEATAVLDEKARSVFTKLILEAQKQGKAILMATNIPEDMKLAADKIIELDEEVRHAA